jgi:hypothetical protein
MRLSRKSVALSTLSLALLLGGCGTLTHPQFGVADIPSRGLAADLLAYWNFNATARDGTVPDRSGHGFNLTLFNGASLAPGGILGRALRLDNPAGAFTPSSSQQYAGRTVNDTAFDLLGTPFSIQVWVNFADPAGADPGGREQTLIEKFFGTGGPGWTLTTPPFAGGLQYYDNGFALNAAASYGTGIWHQVVAVGTGTTLTLYKDGSAIATIPAPVNFPPASPLPLLIGRRNAFDPRSFPVNGLMDEIAVWTRALSATEVSTLFNGGQGRPVTPAEPSSSGD